MKQTALIGCVVLVSAGLSLVIHQSRLPGTPSETKPQTNEISEKKESVAGSEPADDIRSDLLSSQTEISRVQASLSISGTVRDGGGAPIPGARVVLYKRGTQSSEEAKIFHTFCDANGMFILPDDPTASSVCVESEGYCEITQDLPPDREALEFVLTRRAVDTLINGMVVDPQGQPVPRYRVMATYAERDSSPLASWTEFSSASGCFSLPVSLRRGDVNKISLRIQSKGFVEKEVSPIFVSEGANNTELIRVGLETGVGVFGIVKDRHDIPINGAKVQIFYETGALGPRLVTKEDGIFECEVESRSPNAIWVRAPGLAPRILYGRDIENVWEGVVIYVDEGTSIDGRVVTRGGLPVANATIRLDSSGVTDDPFISPPLWQARTMSDREGKFRVSRVPMMKVAARVSVNLDGVEKPYLAVALDATPGGRMEVVLEASTSSRVSGRIEIPLIPNALVHVELLTINDELGVGSEVLRSDWIGVQGKEFTLFGPEYRGKPIAATLKISLSREQFALRSITITSDVVALEPIVFDSSKLSELSGPQEKSSR